MERQERKIDTIAGVFSGHCLVFSIQNGFAWEILTRLYMLMCISPEQLGLNGR
jgi:hypothetical protein